MGNLWATALNKLHLKMQLSMQTYLFSEIKKKQLVELLALSLRGTETADNFCPWSLKLSGGCSLLMNCLSWAVSARAPRASSHGFPGASLLDLGQLGHTITLKDCQRRCQTRGKQNSVLSAWRWATRLLAEGRQAGRTPFDLVTVLSFLCLATVSRRFCSMTVSKWGEAATRLRDLGGLVRLYRVKNEPNKAWSVLALSMSFVTRSPLLWGVASPFPLPSCWTPCSFPSHPLPLSIPAEFCLLTPSLFNAGVPAA